MEKKTVFIKRYPSKGELPKEYEDVNTDCGLGFYGDGEWHLALTETYKPDYWLEEIELPSEKEINNELDAIPWGFEEAFKEGANFILNKLKGE